MSDFLSNTTSPKGFAERVKDFFGAFSDLFRLPRAFWILIFSWMFSAVPYFGIIILMPEYLPRNLGISDKHTGWILAGFSGCVTLFMLGVGELAERLGTRKGLYVALGLCFLGRVIFTSVPMLAQTVGIMGLLTIIGLTITAIGEGMNQPVTYSGVKHYSDEKTNAMAYGLLYAMMNLGIFMIGLISPQIRVPVDHIIEARKNGAPEPSSIFRFLADIAPSGFVAVNIFCTAISGLVFLLFLLFFTRRTEASRLSKEDSETIATARQSARQLSLARRVLNYFREGPFGDARFVFFVFILLPVQTLFAHQIFTMTPYIMRAFPKSVQDHTELIANGINPWVIFLGVPIAAALTRRAHVYTMMIVGTLVSAVPTFLLCLGPNIYFLLAYLVIFSIGEALWQPRLLQYAAEIAPEGKVAQYMGLSNVPWITAKMTTGLYSGIMLNRYCPLPENGQLNTETMWFFYGLIALISPIGLILGRKWVMSGSQMGGIPKSESATS